MSRKKTPPAVLCIFILIAVVGGCTVSGTGKQISPAPTIEALDPSESRPSAELVFLPPDAGTMKAQGPIPAPAGDEWYDWNKVGAYPNDMFYGTALTGDDKYLYYIDGVQIPFFDNVAWLLYRCDLNGSNRMLLDAFLPPVSDLNCDVNCMKGYVYYKTGNGLFRIRNDGSGKTQIINEPVYNMLVLDDKILYTIRDSHHLYSVDAGGKKADLGVMEGCHLLSYDNGILYNGNQLSEEDNVIVYMFDLNKQKNEVLFDSLFEYYAGMHADFGKLYYISCNYDDPSAGDNKIISYDVKRRKKTILLKADKNVPFGLYRFDRYLIYATRPIEESETEEYKNEEIYTIWGYDLKTGKQFQFGRIKMNSEAFLYVSSTPKYIYFNNCRLIFKDGGVQLERLKTDII